MPLECRRENVVKVIDCIAKFVHSFRGERSFRNIFQDSSLLSEVSEFLVHKMRKKNLKKNLGPVFNFLIQNKVKSYTSKKVEVKNISRRHLVSYSKLGLQLVECRGSKNAPHYILVSSVQ